MCPGQTSQLSSFVVLCPVLLLLLYTVHGARQAIAEAARGSSDGPTVPPALLASSGVLEAPPAVKSTRKHPFAGDASPTRSGAFLPCFCACVPGCPCQGKGRCEKACSVGVCLCDLQVQAALALQPLPLRPCQPLGVLPRVTPRWCESWSTSQRPSWVRVGADRGGGAIVHAPLPPCPLCLRGSVA
jgi:hypothetical protein